MTDLSSIVELIGAGWGMFTSLIVRVPVVDKWLYTKVSDDYRGLVFLGLSLIVPLGIVLVSCIGLYNLVPCVADIWKDMLRAWISFAVANITLFLTVGDSKTKQLIKTAKQGLLAGKGRKSVEHPVEETNAVDGDEDAVG